MTSTSTSPLAISSLNPSITWERLPDDFILPDDPVDNIDQPAIAAALTDSLVNNGLLDDQALTTTNYGICAKFNNKFVVKAPDWAYISQISASRESVNRSYTPYLQGEIPSIVMEFLSETEGGEYSTKPTYPPGKWFFYEKILKVPNYIIFEPKQGSLECYHLNSSGNYELVSSDESGRYWISEMGLYLGLWDGRREQRKGYWLRWWTQAGALLLWGSELAEFERQRAETESQKAETERQWAEIERQRAETESQKAETERQRAEIERQRAETESQKAEIERQRAETESQKAEIERQRAETESQRAQQLANFLREQGFNPDEI